MIFQQLEQPLGWPQAHQTACLHMQVCGEVL